MQHTITQGVNINFIPTKQFKTTRITINFLEELSIEASAMRVLLSYMLETNSEDYPTQSLLEAKLQSMYGANFQIYVRKIGNRNCLTVQLNIVNDQFIMAGTNLLLDGVAFLAQILFRPNLKGEAFEQATFEREKENLLAYIDGIYDDKQEYADIALNTLYFGAGTQQATPSYGTVEVIKTITPSSLYKYYKKMITTNPIEIQVLGNHEESDVLRTFTDLNFGQREPFTDSIFYQQPLFDQIKRQEEIQDVNQGKLNLAYQVPSYYYDDHYYDLLVMNGLFGGSPLSLLFANVREKESLAYYASSGIDPFRGLVTVQTGIDSQKQAQVQTLIGAQVQKLINGDFTQEMFQKTKALLINSFMASLDSPASITGRILNATLVGRASVDEETFQQKIVEVTKEDVCQMAASMILQATYFLKGKEPDNG